MKILIIEDDPTDRKLMAVLLEASGHAVREKGSAEDALEAIAVERPDLILLDLRLPGMDGVVLASRLKADGETREIPIVAVTAYTQRYRREELLEAGCDACIVKPFDTRDFARRLEEVAERKARRQSTGERLPREANG